MTAIATTTRPSVSTRTLLTAGAVAAPLWAGLSLAQAFTRDGFDLTRHPLSLLSTGPLGWLQITNFVVAGVLLLAGATGLRRVADQASRVADQASRVADQASRVADRASRVAGQASRVAGQAIRVADQASRVADQAGGQERAEVGAGPGCWAPRLIAISGAGMVGAGVLVMDPMTVPAAASMSWHSVGHMVAGSVTFAALIAACFVLARRFRSLPAAAAGTALLVGDVWCMTGGTAGSLTLAIGAITAMLYVSWTAANHSRRP